MVMQFFLAYILRHFFVAAPLFAPAPLPVVTAGHVHRMILMMLYLRSGSVSRHVAVGPLLSPTMRLLLGPAMNASQPTFNLFPHFLRSQCHGTCN